MKYLGSEKHIENVKKAQKSALEKIKDLKNKRILNYYLAPNICNECDNKLPYDKKNNKFCSSSCAAKYNNKKRGKKSDETKMKISKSLKNHNEKKKHKLKFRKCKLCDKNFKVKRVSKKRFSKSKFCSEKCRKDNNSLIIKNKIKNGEHKGWHSRNIISYPEKFFIEVLKNNNINFEHNYPIKQSCLGVENQYNYFLDFFIPEKNIDLEIDGSQHKYRKEHDKLRDGLLTKNGYNVYRIKWKNINTPNGKKYIKEEINKFLDYYNNIN